MFGMRVRRTLAVAAVTLASVSWGASASAAPTPKAPAHHPVVISHLMSSCGDMDSV